MRIPRDASRFASDMRVAMASRVATGTATRPMARSVSSQKTVV
jgi:hypothetical protein